MMHNGAINIIRRPLHVKGGACQNIWRYYLYCAFQQTRERKGNQEIQNTLHVSRSEHPRDKPFLLTFHI